MDIKIERDIDPSIPSDAGAALELVAHFKGACDAAKRMGLSKADFLAGAASGLSVAWEQD